MSLNTALKDFKKQFEQSAPKNILEIMHNATEQLRNSGIMKTTLTVGDKAPEFTLSGTNEQCISLSSCLARGPVVVTFFRGQW